MSSFDAIFLHEVASYTRGASPTPDIPDWKSLQRRLSEVENIAKTEWQNNDAIAADIKGIASDYDFDDTLDEYTTSSSLAINNLHRGIRDAYHDLLTNWDPDRMTKDQMVTFVEDLKDQLGEYLPRTRVMREIVFDWYGFYVSKFIGEHHALGRVFLNYTTDDIYVGDLQDTELGGLEISACAGGTLKLVTKWVPGYLYFTQDDKIVLGSGKPDSKIFAMKVVEFRPFFEDWTRPTEEEIALFDVLYPGADWTVLRYLRDYEEKNYISNSKPVRIPIPVCTSL